MVLHFVVILNVVVGVAVVVLKMRSLMRPNTSVMVPRMPVVIYIMVSSMVELVVVSSSVEPVVARVPRFVKLVVIGAMVLRRVVRSRMVLRVVIGAMMRVSVRAAVVPHMVILVV